MKKLVQLLAVILAIGAATQAVTSFVAQADSKSSTKGGGNGEPGP